MKMIQWISIKEQLPKYVFDTLHSKFSATILIFDEEKVRIGDYENGQFVWWSGSFRNIDEPNSQKTITHWAEINLPEKTGAAGGP